MKSLKLWGFDEQKTAAEPAKVKAIEVSPKEGEVETINNVFCT